MRSKSSKLPKPGSCMNNILMEIVIDTICFFELIPDEVLDPDIAIGELEGIGASLKQLSLAERKEFVRHIKWMAESTLHPEKRHFC